MELKNSHIKLLRFLKSDQNTIKELAEKVGMTQQTIRGRISELKKAGYAIYQNRIEGDNTRYYLPRKPVEKQIKQIRHGSAKNFRIALCSDTHLGAHTEALDELNQFYEMAHDKGVKDFYHSGDLTDGTGVYPGHDSELKIFTGPQQVQYTIDNYPYIKGCTTYYITGNHDLKIMQREDLDIGGMISEKREDMVYLGQYESDVFFRKASLRLVHPDGAYPYALSYRAQKYIENISGGTKPNIISMGHLHQSAYMEIRNIHTFLAGSFQKQNNFLRRKGINPAISGWILDFKLLRKNIGGFEFDEITDLKIEKIRFY